MKENEYENLISYNRKLSIVNKIDYCPGKVLTKISLAMTFSVITHHIQGSILKN